MENPATCYWDKRIEKCKEALIKNNFEVFRVETLNDVKATILNEILPAID